MSSYFFTFLVFPYWYNDYQRTITLKPIANKINLQLESSSLINFLCDNGLYLEDDNNIVFTNEVNQKIFDLIKRSFLSLNIDFSKGIIGELRSYFELGEHDDETLVTILSMLITHGFCLLNPSNQVTFLKLINFRDNYIKYSTPWNRINTLCYFYRNNQKLMNIGSKEDSEKHTDKLFLYELLRSNFIDKPQLMNKLVDIISMMYLNTND